MADDKHYVGGSHYLIDDVTGFKVRSYKARKQWNNLIVRDQSWEPRQPQDFVRGVPDDQSVTDPRPRQPNVFLTIQTNLTVAAPAQASSVTVASAGGMSNGDRVSVMQDNGEVHVTTLNGAPVGQVLTLASPLTWPAAIDAQVTDWTYQSPLQQQGNFPSDES